MRTLKSYKVDIYLGLRKEYSEITYSINMAYAICRDYCDKIGLCITVIPIRYIYSGGYENGCIIGLINYARFPRKEEDILEIAIELAKILKKEFNQIRITVQDNYNTYLLEEENETI